MALLKAGVWKDYTYTKDKEAVTEEALPNSNRSMLNILPVGNWYKSGINEDAVGTVCAYWTWDNNENKIPEETVFFMSQSNDMEWKSVYSSGGTYYRAISVRCIRE